MSTLIATFGSVTSLVLGMLIGVLWLWAAAQSKWPKRWLAAVALISLTATVHGVARIASWPLRHGFQSFEKTDAPPAPTAIVVLGAGARTVHGSGGKIGVLTLGGAAHVLEAARLFRLLDRPWIVSSGGAPAGYDMIPESETMKNALVDLGVPAERIVLESSSRVTRDEAVLTARILHDLGITSCIVVTSDLHMRRALASFRHEGLRAVPAIARDPLDSQRPLLSWLPTTQGMAYSQDVVHEYVGLAWYWWRGWT